MTFQLIHNNSPSAGQWSTLKNDFLISGVLWIGVKEPIVAFTSDLWGHMDASKHLKVNKFSKPLAHIFKIYI